MTKLNYKEIHTKPQNDSLHLVGLIMLIISVIMQPVLVQMKALVKMQFTIRIHLNILKNLKFIYVFLNILEVCYYLIKSIIFEHMHK